MYSIWNRSSLKIQMSRMWCHVSSVSQKGYYSAHCLSRSVVNLTTRTPEQTHWGCIPRHQRLQPHYILDSQTQVVWGGDFIQARHKTEVTAISEGTYSALGKLTLLDPFKILYGTDEQKLIVLGQFQGSHKYKQKSWEAASFCCTGTHTQPTGYSSHYWTQHSSKAHCRMQPQTMIL